mmetsp:Transcript_52044/g.97638  ORF Transcript_52044/g.97638 Transcript_52044/m.97638 type:complete len:82 (-) Transcript_52044:355-600(-)
MQKQHITCLCPLCQPLQCAQNVRARGLGSWLIVGEDAEITLSPTKASYKQFAHPMYIIDAATKLGSGSKIVDADEQRSPPT